MYCCAQCGLAMHPVHAMQTGAKGSTIVPHGKARHDHHMLKTLKNTRGHHEYDGDDPSSVHARLVHDKREHREEIAKLRSMEKQSKKPQHKHGSDEDLL
jgi:hypothetical protein